VTAASTTAITATAAMGIKDAAVPGTSMGVMFSLPLVALKALWKSATISTLRAVLL
jgi:PDZ domain-containing secreted protein